MEKKKKNYNLNTLFLLYVKNIVIVMIDFFKSGYIYI